MKHCVRGWEPRAEEQPSWALLCIRAASGAHYSGQSCNCPQGLGTRFNSPRGLCWRGVGDLGGHFVRPGQAVVQRPPPHQVPGEGVLSPSPEAEQEIQSPAWLLLVQRTSATA